MTVYECPHCKGDFDVTSIHEGKVVACPMCKGSFQTSIPTATPPSLAVPTRSSFQGRPIYRRSRRHKPSQYSTWVVTILGSLVFLGTIGGVALYVNNKSGRVNNKSDRPKSRSNLFDNLSVRDTDTSLIATIRGESDGVVVGDFKVTRRGVYTATVDTLPSTKFVFAYLYKLKNGEYEGIGSVMPSSEYNLRDTDYITKMLDPGSYKVRFERILPLELEYVIRVRRERLE